MSPFSGQPPAAVLFDLDGTLLDSVPSLAAALDRVLLALDRPPAGIDAVRAWVGNGAQTLIERALAGNHAARPPADGALVAQALALFLDYYGEQPTAGTLLYPGVVETLERLSQRRVPMAIVTNKPARFVAPLLDSFAIGHHFSLLLGGDSLAQQKPAPQPLLYAADHFGVAAARCLMVGDSITDVRAARAAGMPVAWVSYGYHQGLSAAQLGADWAVDSLTELL